MLGFKLYVDALQEAAEYQLVYEGTNNQHTVLSTDTTPNLVTGTTYRYVLVAYNSYGDSPISEEIRIALGCLPLTPSKPTKIEELSSLTSIAVQWERVEFLDDVPVDGYHLWMDDGLHGDFKQVYNGSGLPFNTTFTAERLVTGLPYRFKLQSENRNGFSDFSEVLTVYACLKPSNMPAAFKTATTKTSITIQWQEPEENGCPIQGFDILHDYGVNGAFQLM